jgi:hypothetical protein
VSVDLALYSAMIAFPAQKIKHPFNTKALCHFRHVGLTLQVN